MIKVEWKTIGDICTNVFAGGTPSTKHEEYYDGDIPWIRSGEIDFNTITRAERNITQEGYYNSSAKLIRYGSVVMEMTGATFAKSAIVEFETTANQSVCAIETDESIANYKYVYFYLSKDYFKIKSSAQGALTSLNLAMIRQIEIPIPSLQEQKRIVGILDTFTASIDNLKEQIAQRRKQYEYFRDKLLDLEGKEGVEMKTLGEVCEVTDYVANGSFASLRENVEYKQEHDNDLIVRTVDLSNNFKGDKIYIDERAYKFLSKTALYGGEIIINNIGAGVGQTFMCPYLDEKMSLGPNSIMVRTSNNHFFYYWFNSTYGQNSIMKVVTPGAMPKFNKTGFKTILAPLPSLSEQQRIVSILDTFEASIQNLEAQLSQREKQYEYYRNKLLTFE